jgi:hypothetical protein
MRSAIVRTFVVVSAAVAMAVPVAPTAPAAPASHRPPAAALVRALPPDVVTAALEAPGTVVRRAAGLTVETLGLPGDLYRVSLEGRFPPRAMRYVVSAGGKPVAFGIPGANGRSVRAITTDPAVLTSVVTADTGSAGSEIAGGPTAGGHLRPGRFPDPAGGGPFAVTRAVYKLGNQVFQPSELGGKVDLVGDVHYPTDLGAGPFPLVLFMHGNHSTCYQARTGRADYRWPCKTGWRALPNYAGYDYIASRLASYGYVVVSVSANGVNVLGNNVDDTGMRQRGEVLEKHIDLWNGWNTTGGDPFGSTFVGAIDMTRIGTMGHSRGGEGVVWNRIVDEERPDPYGIDAVLALAPVDFTRATINDVPFTVMLPYCDGDVSDLEGVHFFDDSRYLVPGDTSAKSTVTVFGANHNFFNTVWSPSGGYPGAFDDGQWTSCKDQLTQVQERRVGAAYVVGFFRRYVGGETSLDPMWTGAATPESIDPARTLVSYLAPDAPGERLDVDRFTDPNGLAVGQTGGAVQPSGLGLYGWCANTYDSPCVPGGLQYWDRNMPGLAEALLGWGSDGGTVRFRLPSGSRDVSGFAALTFRAVVNPGYDQNRYVDYQDLEVALIDGDGNEASVAASKVGNEALRYPISRRGAGHVLMNQVRFPLSVFAGVDLSDVRSVQFRLTRTFAGVIDVSDVAFAAQAS